MNADRVTALREAILHALPVDLAHRADAILATDAIVDAVIAVDGAGGSIEWGVRSRRANKNPPKVFCISQDEEWVRYFHNARKRQYELVRRRASEWEAVD